MRILAFTQFFPPEVGATQTRIHTFASGLAARGHEVSVVCEVPNHPQGVVRPEFRGRAIRRRRMDGFEAWYVWVWTSQVKSTRARLGFYGSYAAMASALATALPRPDVVFASAPPLPVGAVGAYAATRHRVPWLFDVRDLWPEFPVAVGELTNPRTIAAVERLAHGLYGDADAVTAVTEPFCAAIRQVVRDPDKVHLLPNGTTRLWLDAAELAVDRDELGLPADRFVWTYAGNVGPGQGLDAAIDAAGLLGDGFLLLILGDGPSRAALEARAAETAPGRVEFRDQVPPPLAARYLRGSDALLVSLAPNPALADFVPSKLYDCCAAGRPVVVAAAGEPTRLAEATGAALPVAPGDASELAAAVARLRDDADLRGRLSSAGRSFGAASLRDRHVDRLEELLEDIRR